MFTYQIAVFVVLVCTSLGKDLPSEFKKCKRTDPNFGDCLKDAFQSALPLLVNGNSELGVVPLKPLTIPSATIGEGKGAVNVVQNYKNFKIHHLWEAKIEKVESTLTKDSKTYEWIAHIFLADLVMDADYDFNGRVLLLPIVGKGKCLISLKNTKTIIRINFETYEKDGKTYTKAKDCKLEMNPEKVSYQFDNLFNGDERLGKEMNKVLNENSKEVFEDIKPGYEELIATLMKSIANNIFSKVPFDILHPE